VKTPGWQLVLAQALGMLLLTATLPIAADPPGGDDWKYDIIHRKKGKPLCGLVLEEGPNAVKYLYIARRPGSPTILVKDEIARAEIDRIERLDDHEREILEQRVKALRQERETLNAQLKAFDPATKEKPTGDKAMLKPAKWPADARVKAVLYESAHFRLISTAREELVQLTAIQLEQVYAAYARTLPARVEKAEKTTILLTQSQNEYQALIRDRGHNLLNPAYYDVAKNQIVCGNDLQRKADQLEELRKYHAKELKDLDDREKDLRQVYKGTIPPEFKAQFDALRKKIKTTEEQNNEAFNKMRRRLFERLYHEAFHAYLANFVYPNEEGELPRWLNEGLAQVFETAIFEIGELRIGHADRERLEAAQKALNQGTLLPLSDLLKSGPKQFQVAHAADQQVSDRYYLASWALAFHLTFDRKVLGTAALDSYVKALRRGVEPQEAFRALVGMPLPQFEKRYQQYLKQLQPDGTALGKK
jgi:Protein of unknown function (DUF1570)